ncbi:DUF4256 domain-containing protein [Lewinella sp. JB7]|uniref:DUF4256 domain-containing protein n=1 Tax=Lewinella sp. JB7 TaxID=2962887 RepID=UPI0035320FA3
MTGLRSYRDNTSSWLMTPAPVRKLGDAPFGDHPSGRVFVLRGVSLWGNAAEVNV